MLDHMPRQDLELPPPVGFVLRAEHDRLIAEKDAEVARLKAERDEAQRRRDEWRAKAEGYDAVRLALREKVGAPWPPHMSRLLWAGIAADERKRADDAASEVAELKARIAELEYVCKKVVAAANLHDQYNFMPPSKNRIGDSKSPKSRAKDIWMRALRKAEILARTAIKGDDNG